MKLKIERDYEIGIDLEIEAKRIKSNNKQSSKDREELSKVFSGEDFNF